jgi:serine/threonine-protein kinase
MTELLDRLSAALAGRYRVARELGRGGMARVYLAEEEHPQRHVAIKVLDPDISSIVGPERFLREVNVAAKLRHPHILTIHSAGEAGDLLYYVMPYVEGGSLRDRLNAEKQLPLDDVLRIAGEVADALSYAHSCDVVHRDIKPENILLDAGHAIVADFGIARAITASGGEKLTETGLAVGTPAYASPEQGSGSLDLDGRSDLYSLGCVLYEMLAGHPPFTGTTVREVLARHSIDAVPPLRPARPSIPEWLNAIVVRVLAKVPADRFATAEQFAETLSAAGRGDAISLPKSVAVLPFVNMSAEAENEYFSDGVTEDIIAQLAKIGGLKVISRTSAMRYKGTEKGMSEIARELGVSTILEGSVRRAGERVRIVAQLIDTETDEHLWADTYDREFTDIFAIQSDVALQIAEALKTTLSPGEKARIVAKPTDSVLAYNAYLLGRFYWNKRTEPGMQRALEHFRDAIDADSEYALAYVGVADCYNLLPFYGDRFPGETYPKAQAAALRALELNSSLAEAHASLAGVKQWFEWDWPGARREFERAIELSPGYALAYLWYAWFWIAQGNPERALAEGRRVEELDPLSLIASTDLGELLYYARQYEDAIAQHRKTLEMDPRFWVSHLNLARAYVQVSAFDEALKELQEAATLSEDYPSCEAFRGYTYAMMGKRDDALGALERLLKMSRERNVPSYLIALVHAGLGDLDEAFSWLDRALARRDSAWLLYYVSADPWADALRPDSRFAGILRAFNLEG